MGIISHLVSGKKGRLYLHFIVAVAIIAATFYAYSALAAVPSATPSIVNTNATTVNGVPIANASIARALDQLFGYANFSSENASFEENSTFKWLKRTLYQPQNRSLVLYQKLDGNANDSSPAGHLGTMLNGVRSNLSMNCRIDDCLSFDGVNDFVNVTDNFRFPDLDSRDWTVELWAYVINKQGTNSKSPGLWALDGSHLLYFFNEGATLQMYWSTDLITVNGVTNNTWHHFAVTRGGNTFTLFVDGVNRGSGTNSNRATSTGFMLGTQTGGDYTLNGSIDEVAIWSYNKSAAEIAADYKNSPYSAMIYKDAVAYWHFDENGGTDGFADSSGSGNNVISGNPGVTNVSGITRGAVRFSASSSYMIVLSNASLNTTPNISVSVWIKGEPGGVQNPRPIANANKDLNGGFSLYLRGATRVPVGLFINTTGGELEVSGTTPLNDSRWHHVAFTLNGTTMSMYVDGENQASAAFNGVLGGNAANITLGAGDGRNGDFFQGALDELAIYNRSLTASEVKQLYLRTWYDQSPQQFLLHPNYPDEVDNASNSGNTTLLLHFNEGTGTTAVDSSGRGSNGILLGSSNATWTNDSISGSALRFDGVDDTVEITNPPRFDGAFTMMVWNKRSSTSNAPHIYYGTNSAYDIMCDADPRPAPDDVNFYINGAGFAQLNSPTTPITQNNTWYHEACVYNGSAMLIYVNGRLEAEQAVTGTNPPDTAGGFMKLGIDPRFAGRLFNGTLDEVKIVNRSLSAAEIAAEYRKSCPFCTSDGEMPTVDPYSKGVSWQPGRYAENLTVDGNTVSYLRFDEGTGTSVNDIGLYSNDATVYGSRWTDDSVSGKALNTTGQFNTDFVVIPWSDSLNFSRNKQFTFEAWIKFQNFNNYNYIFTTGNKTEGANPEAGQGAYLRATDDGTLQLTIGDGGASSFGGYSPTAYTVLNRWYLVTVTYNASHGQMYVDGTRVLLSPQNTNAKISPDGKNNTGIGTNLADGNTIFNGTIDEVRILNRSLSAAEVLADYRKAAKGLGLLSNDYVQYNASTNFNPSEGAVEFWVKPEWNGNDNLAHVLFDTETAADFNITKTTGNDLAVFVGNPGSVLLRSSISGWTSGYWRHVAVAWNNYTSNITLLVDGSQVNSSSTAFTIPAAANSRTFTLGANGSGTSNWCNCTFSEFRISRKALSAQEINESFSRARQLYSNEFMLNRSNFAKGDSFRVEYTPRDRENQTGTPVNSSILTVVNSNVTEPTVTDFGLAGIAGSETAESVAANRASSATPLNATFLSQINITWNPSADNDSETVSYAVLINNTLVCATTATSCNTTQLPSWTSAAGAAFYIFNVTASDGEMNASTTTYAFNFDNSTPTVSIVATTAANNTFQNTTSHFINFTVTEARIDKVLLNITGPSFAGTGGNGALSSGRNITLWDKDLVGMWHFEENNGTNTTNDSSGFGHHGNVVLPNVNSSNESRISGFNSSGRFGGGMLFDGRDDFVNFTTSLDGVLNNTFTGKEITVSAWFIHRPSASCWQRIIDKAHDAEGGGDQTFHLGLGSNDIARCGVSFSLKTSGGSVSNYPNYEITTIGNDTWVHAVLVYNGTHLLGYVNTNLSYSTPLTGDIQYTTDYMHLGVGHLANLVLSGFFNGSLDEVKIWRRALTTAEISEEYNRTASNYFVSHNFSGSSHLFSVNLTNLTNGNYSHFIWVNDSSSQSATTAAAVATTAIGQRIFSVDTIAPSISLIANTPANASVLGSSFIFINTSENDAGNNHNDFSAFVDFNSSLVGYWRFEDDGDTNASDFTNYNNNGTLTNFGCLTLNCNLTGGSGGTGSGWTSGGKRGKALVFDGENDFVNTTNDESVNFTSKNFTVEAWIKPAFSGGTHTIVSKGAQEVASWRFFIYQNTWLILETVNSGGNPQTGINNYAFANNTWYHVAAVRTGDNVTVYIDGVNRTNILAVHNNIIPTTKNLVIGSVGTGAQFFNGSIDEVKVWSRALSSQEINASFQAGTYGLFRNFTGLNDGNYSYRAFVVDAAGNVNRTEARNVTVDTVAPTISFIAPTDANASFLNRTWTLVNTSTTETSEHSVFVDFNRSLVGYWRFEDDGDTNASDFSSYNNNGTLVNFGCLAADCNLTGGATRVASGFVSSGKRGKALAFDGDGDYVNVSNSASFNVENFTIEMWFNPKDADGFTNTLLNRHAQTTGDGHWWLHTDLTEFQFGYSNSSTTPQVSLASTFSKDVWAHIAVTFSRATGNVTLYKNGAFTSTNISYNMLNTTSGDLYIGSYQGIASYSFNGTIDEVKIWNRALNETEINASYSAGTYRYSKNFTGLSDGNYSYYAAVVDSAGTLVQTTNRTIYVDTVAPAISLIANTPANASVLGSSFIFINTSENDAGNNHNELSAFIDFNNSLVGYWRFEEGSGNVSVDFSGYGNNGNISGISTGLTNWTSAGKRGGGLYFNGSGSPGGSDSSNLTIPGSVSLNNISEAITMEAWVNPDRYTGSGTVMIKDGSSYLQMDTAGQVIAYFYGLTAPGYHNSGYIVPLNTWTHLAVVYNGSHVNIYRNGVENYTNASSGSITKTGLVLASDKSGVMDELKIWNRALSRQEINASFHAGNYRLFRNFSGLADGNYTYRAYSVDASGNVNRTEARNVTVDTVAPTISFIAPTGANASFLNRTWTLVNTSTTEASEHSVFVNFNGSLVGYWRFEDDGDTNASDFTSNNNNGTLVNFGCTAADCNLTGGAAGVASGFVSSGKRGKAMAFDGVGDYVSLGNPRLFGGNVSNASMAFWVKPADSWNTDSKRDFIFADIASSAGLQLSAMEDNGDLRIVAGNSSQDTVYFTDVNWNKDVWTHIGIAYNGTHFLFYQDGVLGSVNATTLRSIGESESTTATIGATSNTLNGTLDEVMIWNRALDAQEINASFKAGTYRYSKNFTGLNDGNYSYYAAVVDSAGTLVQTTNRTIYVDTKGPGVTYDAASFANATFNKFVTINVTANDTANDHNDFSAFVDFNNGLVGYWRFEEGEVNTTNRSVADFSSYGSVGNLTNFGCLELNCNLTGGSTGSGSGWTSGGKRGKALAFDGENDYVRFNNASALYLTGNHTTIEAWVYARNKSDGYFVSKDAHYRLYTDFSFDTGGADKYRVDINNGSWAVADTLYSSKLIVENKWEHVAVTFNGTRMVMYVNGEFSNSTSLIGPVREHPTDINNLTIGARKPTTSYFNGSVDEVKIWNRTLSAQEINASFNAGRYRLIANITSSDSKYADGNFTYAAYVVDAAGNVNTTGAPRLVVLDNTAPVIAAIRTFSNSSGHLFQSSNSTSAVVAYFNSIAPAATADGGGGQEAIVEVTYTDLYRSSLNGNLTFGDVPSNITRTDPTWAAYTIETGSGNATAAVYANDSANNTATATVRFILDVNDTVTTDNSSSSSTWFSTNVTINLTAVDVANGSGANRTLWCTFTAGTPACTPSVEVANPTDFRLPLNCSTGSSCQVRIRYYSLDNVSNNESGGANGGAIRESNSVNIATGGSDVQDALVNNSVIMNGSFVRNSNVTNSTVNNCRVTDSVVVRSVLFRNIDHVRNCSISDSVVIDSNLTSVVAEKKSYIDPSVVIDSVITNSSIRNSTVSFSRVENSTFCGNFSVWTAAILNNTLIDGRIVYNGSNYFGPVALSSICGGVAPSPVGSLAASPSAAKDGDNVTFTYTGAAVGYTVTISSSELFVLDNTSTTAIALNDNGTYRDAVANDAVYAANYSISPLNNQSDGNKTIVAQVFDNLGNNWTVRTNVTLDNTPPSAAIVINSNSLNTTSAPVTLNLTFSDATTLVKDCRFANEDRAFGSYEGCAVTKVWTLSGGNGLKTVVVQVRDSASNVNETNDTITLQSPATTIITPLAGEIIKGGKTVVVIAPDAAAWVTFNVTNATNSNHTWSLAGTANAITNDTSPSDGFTQTWVTTATAFANESKFNLTVISYDASGYQLSNDTEGNIEVDNNGPNITFVNPIATVYNRTINLSVTVTADARKVVFEYSPNSGLSFFPVGADEAGPDWNFLFDTTAVADGTTYVVRANATDDAGNAANASSAEFTVDNTPPVVNITSPAAGAKVSGTVSIQFTADGASRNGEVQFDGGNWIATSGSGTHSWDTASVNDSAHAIRVRANDSIANVGYSDIRTFVVDNTNPVVTITAPANNSILTGTFRIVAVAPADTRNVTFTLSGDCSATYNDLASSDGWTWDLVSASSCGSSEYAVTITARAYDAVGNTQTYGVSGVTIDNDAPEVLVINPTATTNTTHRAAIMASANASSDAQKVFFEYSPTNGSYWIALGTDFAGTDGWNITFDTTAVADGFNYKIRANATDKVGLSGTSTMAGNFTVDNTPPSINISYPVGGMVVNGTVNVSFTGGERHPMISIDGRPVVNASNLTNYSWNTSVETEGTHTVRVNDSDAAGNIGYSNTVVVKVDNTPGVVQIITPRDNALVSGNTTIIATAPDNARTLTFYFFNGSSYNTTIKADANPADGWIAPFSTVGFPDGSNYRFRVNATDELGLFIANDEVINITIDNTAPTVTLDVPNANGLYKGVVAVNASSSADTSKVRFEYRRGSGDWTVIGEAFSQPFKIDWSTTGLPDGTNYEVRANATDRAGLSANVSNANIEVDNTAPVVTINNPTAGTTISGSFNVTFTILGTIHGVQVQFDGGSWANADAGTYAWDTTAYTDATHAVRVKANDSVNNTGYSDLRIVAVDNGGAPVILLEPLSGGYKSGNVDLTVSGPGTTFNVTFNISNSTGFFNTTGNISAVTLDNDSSNGWSAVWDTTRFAEDGTYTVSVRAYSAANALLGTDSAITIEVDNLIPANVTAINVYDYPTDTDGNLVINWTSTASPDLDHYNLYRSQTRSFNASTGTLLKSVAGNTTTDNVPAGTWFYKVTSVDNVGRESNASPEANTTVDLVGPTGTMDINATYARDNDTVKFTYTGSATGFTAIVNASEMQQLDARVLHGFEALWETSNNNSLNMTLNSTTVKAGSFSNRLMTNSSGALGQNITVDLSAGGVVNLSGYNRLLLWVQANITGSILNLTFGSGNYTETGNFTVSVSAAGVWEHKAFDLSVIPEPNRSAVRYVMFNVTASTPFTMLLDDLEASNQVSLLDNGLSGDEVANDAKYTGIYNITPGNNVTDGAKTVKAHVNDGSGNFLAPQDTITVDNTPPNGTVLVNEGDQFSISRTVTLNLTFLDATSGVKDCRFSNTEPVTSAYESCQVLKVWTTTTGGGTKTVYFEVRDQAGNANVSIDSIVLDVSVPAMLITSPLPDGVVNGTINVTFSGAESTQPQISIDGGNWTNTTTSAYHYWNTTNLSEGTHGIRVRDTDAAGNIGYSETLLVRVDNIPGVVTFIQPQGNAILVGNVTVIAVAPDNTRNVSFWAFNVTAAKYLSVYNDTSPADGWNFSLDTSRYEDGMWELYANATNDVGRVFDTAVVNNLRFDNSVPTVTLIAPANGATVRGTVLINATASADVKQVLFEYSNNSGTDWQPIGIDFSPSGGWTFAWFTTAVGDASTYRVRANATDYAGLSSVGQNSADFTIDNTPPALNITAPLPGSFVSGVVDINFTGNQSLSSELRIDGNEWFNITNSTSFKWNTSAYNDGTHTLQVRNNDSVGNAGYSSTVPVIVDNTRPTVVIISPSGNTTVKGNVTVLSSTYPDTARLDFYVDNNTGSGWVLRRSDTNKADGWDFAWDTALDCATTEDCTGVRLRVNSTDAANLTSNFTVSGLEIDNAAPTVTLLYPPDSATIRGIILASAASSNDTRQVVFEYSPDSGTTWYTIGTDPSSASGWNITWDTRQVADASTFRVRANATDNAGLSAAAQNSADFTIDNVEAATTIISPKAGTVVSGNFTVTAIAPDSAFYVLFKVFNGSGNFSFNGSLGFTNDSSPADGWSAKWNTTAFNDSLYNLSAVSYDVNGNYISNGTELGIEVDNTAPTAPTLTALPAFDTDGVVQLEWSNVTASVADVIYYNVYRSTNVSFVLSSATRIRNVSMNFNKTTDFPGVNAKYYYKVAAVDNAFFEGPASNEENTTISVTEAGALVGVLSANDTTVKDGDAIVFRYSSSATDLNVTINSTEMQKLDNASRVELRLLDSGGAPDSVADDAVYTANFTISADNNQSDGNVQLRAIVNDSANNRFLPTVNITIDNTRPNASVQVNNNLAVSSSREVTLQLRFNDTFGVQKCRFANEDRDFDEWESCISARAWRLSATDGLKTVVVQVADNAENVNETNDTVTLTTVSATTIITPRSNSIISGNVSVVAVAPPTTGFVLFKVFNGSGNFSFNGSLGFTNDSSPADGWSAKWNTTAFNDSLYNLSAVSYDVNGNYISNGTELGIEVDNTAPAAPTLTALPVFDTDGVIALNWSNVTASTADVIYYNVYRSTNISFELSAAARIKNVSWSLNATTDFPGINAKYYYKVTAVDNALIESAPSNEVSTTVTTAVGAVFGTLAANRTIVRNGSSVLFTFTGNKLGLNVTINQTEMRKLDNTSGYIQLNDSGINSDLTEGDAVSSAAYTISMLNNESDGNKMLVAEANDSGGNLFRTSVNLTLDNTKPNVTVLINGNLSLTISRIVVLTAPANDSVGIDSCRFANEDRAFGDWEACVSSKVWQLSANTGNKTVVVQARDKANNVQESNDTIEFRAPAPLGQLTATPAVVKNGDNVTFTYNAGTPSLVAVINVTELRRLDNSSSQQLALHDDGAWPDNVAIDGIYTANYSIGLGNNESDGPKRITATMNDTEGNLFRPAVNITLDNTKPNATVSIYGISPAGFANVSTEYTFSRAVTLVVAFNDTAGGTAATATGGIDSCRFANENLVFTGWEACQAVKGWLLSDSNGNKTVVVEVRDLAGSINRTNDSIYLNTTGAGLDQTPPTRPTVTDDGAYTSVDSALHAKWNATDYENELLHLPLEWEYRIAFDSFARRINETWQYAGTATEVTVYSLNLSNGTNYTFEVRAISTAGLRGDNGTSDGITVDTSLPDAPSVSSTHSQSAWSSSNSVVFNWSSNDTISGVSSYSYLLDSNATTIPDNVPEAENEHATLASSHNDGKSTILKFNNTGNATAVFVEVKSNLSVNDVVRVTVQLAEAAINSPDSMGFRVYVITAVPTSFAMNGSNVSQVVDTGTDISFASSLLDATGYTVDVPMSTAVTGSRFFVAVAGDFTDDNNRHNLLLAVSNTSMDASTQSYRCLESDSGCTNTTATADYGVKVEIRDVRQDNVWDRTYTVGDGRMYFHVKAKDGAANWGETTNYTILVDTSAPSTPQMTEPAKFTNTTQVTFNWTASTDADSGVDNYSLQVDNNSDFSSPEFYGWANNVTNYTVTGLTADATYYARVHSRNLAGVNSSRSSSVSTVIDTTAPTITFSKPSSTGVVASQDVVLAVNTNEKAVCLYSLNSAQYLNFSFTNSTYHETKVSASTGSNTVLVKCRDTILNENTPASTTFTVSTTSTASSITLQSLSVFTADVVKTDIIVTTSTAQRLGEIGLSAFTVKIDNAPVDTSVFDNGAGNYTLMFNAPERNGTYTLSVEIGSASATSTLTVQALLFTVQYVQSGITSNAADRLIYFVAGNFTLGLATDSKSSSQQSTGSALNLTSDAKDGTAYIFMTRVGGNVERVESLLKDRSFLDVINPSFGYAIAQDTFVVFTDLEYDDIALTGNKTLTTGRYNLIIENKGFDSTLNKTKLEVRVQ